MRVRRISGVKRSAGSRTLKWPGFAWTFEFYHRGPHKIKDFVGSKFGAFAYYCWAVGLLTVALTFIKG